MTGLGALVRRNIKLYFKDKGMFLTSLITPVILLVLYVTFLGSVYRDSFVSPFESMGVTLPEKVIDGFVGGQLVSSILAVSCVTVAFCSNLLSVQDKISGARRDLNISPVRTSVIALSYFISTFTVSLIISFAAAAVCFVYLSFIGWFMTAAQTAALLAQVVLLVLFGTALSSCIVFPLSTQGQSSAVGTVVSAGYGFICGAYMPVASFSPWLQKVLMFLPGTYGTALIRNCVLNGVFDELQALNIPVSVIEQLRDGVDCNLYFFDNKVGTGAMAAVMVLSVAVLIGVYLLLNALSAKNAKK